MRQRLARRTIAAGSTLVEVLAATAILGGAITSMLVAQVSTLERLRTAKLETTAEQLAHELIAEWRLIETNWEIDVDGKFSSAETWSWKRRYREMEVAPDVSTGCVELALTHHARGGAIEPWTVHFWWLIPDAKVKGGP